MLSPKKIAAIELCYDIAHGLPDGAWWAILEEHGMDADDLEAYWEEQKLKGGKTDGMESGSEKHSRY